nr:hypothetical protein GCM10020092_017570 [Actinoplanes digitatis]
MVEGLVPDSANEYDVSLDDRPVWPLPDSPYPPSVIVTRPADDADRGVSLTFGSCREATAHSTGRRLPPDALDAYARRLMTDPRDPDLRPDLIVLLGDQVYADNTSAKVRRFLRGRRASGHRGPADQVVSFDEYTRLYLESWRDPEVRWLLSTVPSVMIFDDHEIIDDWNTSASWRRDMSAQDWWPERISSGLASYWVYQHLGNLSPDELAVDTLLAAITSVPDATAILHDFGISVDSPSSAENTDRPYQWSFALDIGRTRVVMLDNRCNRVLTTGGREMLPAAEWAWFVDQAHGDYDHLVVGSSLPWLLPPSHPPPRGLERAPGRLARVAPRRIRGEGPPHLRPGALGGLHPLLRRADRAVPAPRRRRAGRTRSPGRRGRGLRGTGVDQRAVRGRAPLVRGAGGPRARPRRPRCIS